LIIEIRAAPYKGRGIFSIYPSKVWSKWITFKSKGTPGAQGGRKEPLPKEQIGNPDQFGDPLSGVKQHRPEIA